jgi:uncharacterized protein YheU (UPF0270 family)
MSTESPVEVPHASLAPATLRAVVEEICMLDGTDYGFEEPDFDEKIARVLAQLARGDAHLVFEARTETLRLVDTAEIRRIRQL